MKLMRFIAGLAVLAMVTGLCSCGSKPDMTYEIQDAVQTEVAVQLPPWFVDPPQDSIYQRAAGESEGYSKQEDATRAARQNAEIQLASWLQTKVQETYDRTRQQLGADNPLHESFARVVKSLTSEKLKGAERSPGHIQVNITQDGMYHVYVLCRMPRNQLFDTFSLEAQKEAELYEGFLRHKLLEEFEEDIKSYEESLDRP